MPRRFTFVGVTTGSSSIMRIFPRWRDVLGLGDDVEMLPCDLPIGAPPERYRDTVAMLRDDPENLGALVTTHKIDLYEAAHDLFDELDANARTYGEVSCVFKRDGALHGAAKDPITAGRALEDVLPAGHWTGGDAEALVLGAGGAGVAIVLHLLRPAAAAERPARITVVDRDGGRLDALRRLQEAQHPGADVVYADAADGAADRLLAALPAGSLVVNATGMGKDRPGSPLTDDAPFPERGVVWELNYRGELDFLRQARAQEQERALTVHDGWRYFIFGWTSVIEEVFAVPIDAATIDRLADAADFARPAPVGAASPDRGA
ncbi:shikimate dehydrogenase family protein [Patulibacter sp. S7RM1-6]